MDLSNPIEALLPGSESAVLSVLATTTEYRSGSEIARLADRSHPTAIKALKRLVEQGLVDSIDSGRATLYSLNRSHLATDPILRLTGLRELLFLRIRDQIETWTTRPTSATVFGSVARGRGDESSDIDLLIVRPADVDEEQEAWQSDLFHLGRLTYLWTGNHLSTIDVGEHEVVRMVRDQGAFYENVKRDGIHIFGQRFSRLSRL